MQDVFQNRKCKEFEMQTVQQANWCHGGDGDQRASVLIENSHSLFVRCHVNGQRDVGESSKWRSSTGVSFNNDEEEVRRVSTQFITHAGNYWLRLRTAKAAFVCLQILCQKALGFLCSCIICKSHGRCSAYQMAMSLLWFSAVEPSSIGSPRRHAVSFNEQRSYLRCKRPLALHAVYCFFFEQPSCGADHSITGTLSFQLQG